MQRLPIGNPRAKWTWSSLWNSCTTWRTLGLLSDLNRHWLKEGGIIAIGIDHYVENPVSISWPDSLGVPMATMSIQEWLDGLEDAGFREVEHHQAGAREGWAGTLVLVGRK